MIEVKNLEFTYGKNPVLKKINFKVSEGEFVGVIGPNGSGKTTLLKLLTGILKPQNGEIILNKRRLNAYSGREVAKLIGYVPQNNNQGFISTTVFDTVLMGRKPYINWFETTRDKKIVAEALDLFNLGEFSLRDINELSGGEKQKVFIARAFVQQPDYFILDEPTNNLDFRHKLEILNILKQLTKINGTVILAIHDLNFALKYCNRIIILKEGEIFADGDTKVINKENIENVYGISVSIIKYEDKFIIIPEDSLENNEIDLSNQLILKKN